MNFQKLFFFFLIIGILMPLFLLSAKEALIPKPDGSGKCKTIQECCSVYCDDIDTYSPPFGTVCFCSKDNPQCPASDPNCEHTTREEGIIMRALNWIFYFVLIGAPFVVLLASAMFFMSGGDQKRAKIARQTIIYAVIGFTFALMARLFYTLIRFLTGV